MRARAGSYRHPDQRRLDGHRHDPSRAGPAATTSPGWRPEPTRSVPPPRPATASAPAAKQTITITASQDYDTADAGLVPPPVLDGQVLGRGQGAGVQRGRRHGRQFRWWAEGDLKADHSVGRRDQFGRHAGQRRRHRLRHRPARLHPRGLRASAVRVGALELRRPAELRGRPRRRPRHRPTTATSNSVDYGGGHRRRPVRRGRRRSPRAGSTPPDATVAGYAFTASVREPGDSFTLTRGGSFTFTLSESGTRFLAAELGPRTLTLSETSARSKRLPLPTGTEPATEYGSLGYTLNQTGHAGLTTPGRGRHDRVDPRTRP